MSFGLKSSKGKNVSEVVLVDECSGADSRRIWASLDANGNLVISGQDIGPKVERIFGSTEYEFSHTVPVAYLAAFFDLLGVDKFQDPILTLRRFGGQNYEKLSDALEQAKEIIPISFWSRH